MKKDRRPIRYVKKDPSRLANQLPRSATGEYLVKDHDKGKSNHLFELNKDDDKGVGDQEGGYHPSFQYSKNKIKSKKDKVFLKGLDIETFECLAPVEDCLSPTTNISVGCNSAYGPADSVHSMTSR